MKQYAIGEVFGSALRREYVVIEKQGRQTRFVARCEKQDDAYLIANLLRARNAQVLEAVQ